jgi:hypothetical protein
VGGAERKPDLEGEMVEKSENVLVSEEDEAPASSAARVGDAGVESPPWLRDSGNSQRQKEVIEGW